MKTLTLVVLGGVAADLVLLLLLLGTVWVAHRAVRREAAARGEVVPSAARDFRYLFAGLLVGLVVLAVGAAILLSV